MSTTHTAMETLLYISFQKDKKRSAKYLFTNRYIRSSKCSSRRVTGHAPPADMPSVDILVTTFGVHAVNCGVSFGINGAVEDFL